jgi:hypothetical protein
MEKAATCANRWAPPNEQNLKERLIKAIAVVHITFHAQKTTDLRLIPFTNTASNFDSPT